MKSCEDCVFHKVYQTGFWCMGVWIDGEKVKSHELIEDYSKAELCPYYDDDSWIK